MWGSPWCLPEICMYCGTEQGTLKTGEFTGPVTVHFIAFFLCKMSLDPEGEAPARQWVKWQVDKMVVILEAVVPSQSLYARGGWRGEGDEAKIWNSLQENKKMLLLMFDWPGFFPYLFMPDIGINIWIASTLTPIPSNGKLIKSQPVKPQNILCTYHVQDKQLMW